MTLGVDLGVDSPLRFTLNTFMVPCYVTVFISIPLNRAPKLGGFLPCRGGILRKSSFACSLRAQYLPDSKFH